MKLYLRALLVLIVLTISISLAGCAVTTTETAHQLDSGDVAVSGSVDWPGYMIGFPRVQANAMYGFGAGDVSAHIGTSILFDV